MKYLTFNDLPSSYSDLIEAIQCIIVGEKLENPNFNYGICNWDYRWEIIFNNSILPIIVPKDISNMIPAYTHVVEDLHFQFPKNFVKFCKEIESNLEIKVMKGDSFRGKTWTVHFVNQKSVYDFYVLGKKYGIF